MSESTIEIISALTSEIDLECKGFPLLDGTPILFEKKDFSILWNETVFLTRIREIGRTPNPTSAVTYAAKLTAFLESIRANGIEKVSDVTYLEIIAYRDALKASGLAHSTINQMLGVVKSYYNFLLLHGKITNSPFTGRLALQEDEIPIRAFLRNELNLILRTLPPIYALMARLAVCTGLRSAEISEMKLSGLPATDTDDPFLRLSVRRKGHRAETLVQCPRELVDELVRWAFVVGRPEIEAKARKQNREWKDPGTIFISQYGRRFATNRFSKEFTKASRKCGLYKKLKTLHGLRHTFGITMLKQLIIAEKRSNEYDGTGMNALLTLKNLMGHKQLESTQRYLTALTMDAAVISDSLMILYDSLHKNEAADHV